MKYYRKPWQRTLAMLLDLIINLLVIVSVYYTLLWVVMPQNIWGHGLLIFLSWRVNILFNRIMEFNNDKH